MFEKKKNLIILGITILETYIVYMKLSTKTIMHWYIVYVLEIQKDSERKLIIVKNAIMIFVTNWINQPLSLSIGKT